MGGRIPEEEKQRRLIILQERQRAIQIRNNAELIGDIQEVLVEGRNQALGQWIGRTSDNRTLNFTQPHFVQDPGGTNDLTGRYLSVRVTRSGPNSLVGESVTVV
jgi:tRNA-2-methylthio-N6-dimethylallyladenosine synthase